MKAPDKIYVEFSEEVNLAFTKQPFEETPCYIRKDALLEWAKGELDKLEVLSDNDAAHWGQRNAFKQVIDKINSL